MAEWQPIETVPESNGRSLTKALLYSPHFGVRDGEVGNYLGMLIGNVANLHGNAIDDWGATHWMPLPPPPTA